MSTQPINTNVDALKTKAMTSLIDEGIQASNPSLSPDSIVEIAPRKITVKFAASEFLCQGEYEPRWMARVGQAVARASWVIARDGEEGRAVQDNWMENHYNPPQPEDEVQVVGRARETAPGLDKLNFTAVVKRNGYDDVRIALGSTTIQVLSPSPPQVNREHQRQREKGRRMLRTTAPLAKCDKAPALSNDAPVAPAPASQQQRDTGSCERKEKQADQQQLPPVIPIVSAPPTRPSTTSGNQTGRPTVHPKVKNSDGSTIAQPKVPARQSNPVAQQSKSAAPPPQSSTTSTQARPGRVVASSGVTVPTRKEQTSSANPAGPAPPPPTSTISLTRPATSSEATTRPDVALMHPRAQQSVRVLEPTPNPPPSTDGFCETLVFEPCSRLKPSAKPAPRILSTFLEQNENTHRISQFYMLCACESIDDLADRAERLGFVPVNIQHSYLFFRKTLLARGKPLLVFYFDVRTEEERKIVVKNVCDDTMWTKTFHKDDILQGNCFLAYSMPFKDLLRTIMVATRNFEYGVRPERFETVRSHREVHFAVNYKKARNIRSNLSPLGLLLLQLLEESVKHLDYEDI
ncbi:unnamed protein product [Caenorhabditis nigoni]